MPPGQPYSFSNPHTAQMSSATSPFLDPPSSSAQQPYRDSFDTTASRPDPGVPGGRDLFFPNSSGGPPSMSREGSHDSVLSSSNGLVAGGVSASRGSRTSLTSAAYSDDPYGSLRRFSPSAGGGGSRAGSLAPTVSEKYALSADTASWENDLSPEPDDELHNPDPKRDHRVDKGGSIFTWRGLMNLGFIALLAMCLLMLFAGYPIYSAFATTVSAASGFNLGGVNGSGQVPELIGNFGLIDADTHSDKYSIISNSGAKWELVFSDEFEQDGRTFYPGDDPYWEAADFHAWATNDMEYYDPRQLTTKDGKLIIELSNKPSHDLNYTGGSMQTWNKFCFTGGRLEASVRLPATSEVYGLWPAFWTMGNLGRVGYGGTLEGLWPYSYDSCDTGTLPNQTLNDKPEIALTSGTLISEDLEYPYALSYLPGQRLSRCTCPDDKTHPGPKHSNGEWVGRSAPEIDVFEAQVDNSKLIGQVSQSGQWAPFNPHYEWENKTHMVIVDETISELNTYQGGNMQQTSSVVSNTNQDCYEYDRQSNPGCYSVYAIEYDTSDNGYISWFVDDKLVWTYKQGGFPAVSETDVSARFIPKEPMYILLNLALSTNFGAIDLKNLEDLWPVHMHVDYVRVYQDPALKNIGCDPDEFPTASYIAQFPEGYTNPNITTWAQMSSASPPGNKLLGQC